ncbi:MAG: tetratricopeptide repeat protein, partial [Oceanococcaceae bacterium]
MNAVLRFGLLGLLLWLAGCSSLGGQKVQTLGPVDRKPQQAGSWFLAAAPSILQYSPSQKVGEDMRLAMAHYEAIATSEADPRTRAEAARRAAYLRLSLAEEMGDAQALEAATQAYQALLAQLPDDPNKDLALYQLARAHQAAGRMAEASRALRRLQTDFPDSPLRGDALFRLAELLFAQKQYAEAAQDYQGVLQADPQGRFAPMARYKLGWAEFKQGHFEAALDLFGQILQESLPSRLGSADPEQALAALPAGQRPWVSDAFKVSSLSLAALGAAQGLQAYFGSAQTEPAYAPLLYRSLGQLLLDKDRLADAAEVYARFGYRHPMHSWAPEFQELAVKTFLQGGFVEDAARSMMVFVDRFAPGAAYWQEQAPTEGTLEQVRRYIDTLGRHFHAQADAASKGQVALYTAAARWYQRHIDLFPQAEQNPAMLYALGECLAGAGQLEKAADAFSLSASQPHPMAAEAAYAAVLAYGEAGQKARQAVRSRQLQARALLASLQLAEQYPEHPHWAAVLLQAAEGRAQAEDWPQALELAGRVLQKQPIQGADRYKALRLKAEAQFALAHFAGAEEAYAQMQQLNTEPAHRTDLLERQALSIYRQGEVARDQQNWGPAAEHFARLGRELPQSRLRDGADYEAAAAWLSLEDFASALPLLQGLIARSPDDPLVSEARRRLAISHERLGQPILAARQFQAVAADPGMDKTLRQEAGWHAAELLDQAGQRQAAIEAYTAYLREQPSPLNRAQQARWRLVQLHQASDPGGAAHRHWLEELIQAEAEASPSLELTRAALELGRLEAQLAAAIPIRMPIERSLLERKEQVEAALHWLNRA